VSAFAGPAPKFPEARPPATRRETLAQQGPSTSGWRASSTAGPRVFREAARMHSQTVDGVHGRRGRQTRPSLTPSSQWRALLARQGKTNRSRPATTARNRIPPAAAGWCAQHLAQHRHAGRSYTGARSRHRAVVAFADGGQPLASSSALPCRGCAARMQRGATAALARTVQHGIACDGVLHAASGTGRAVV
jgi:hypothetical protein